MKAWCCDNLQLDLNAIYDWASKKFSYVCFSSNISAYKSNLYIDPEMNIISPSTHVLDLGVSMSIAGSLSQERYVFRFILKLSTVALFLSQAALWCLI